MTANAQFYQIMQHSTRILGIIKSKRKKQVHSNVDLKIKSILLLTYKDCSKEMWVMLEMKRTETLLLQRQLNK